MISFVRSDNGDLLLHCHIQPKASRDAIAGLHAGRLKIQITAPPTDGKANEHLIRFIARTLGVAKSTVQVEKGTSSRQKTLRIQGLSELPPGFQT